MPYGNFNRAEIETELEKYYGNPIRTEYDVMFFVAIFAPYISSGEALDIAERARDAGKVTL